MKLPGTRALAEYSDEYPVTIDRIIDVEESCEPGTNCLSIICSDNVLLDEGNVPRRSEDNLLIISTITLLLEEGDDPDVVKNDITESVLDSFADGSFFDAIPADTVVSPRRDV